MASVPGIAVQRLDRRHRDDIARLQLDRLAHGGAIKEALADQFALVDSLLKQQYLWLAQPKSGGEMPPGKRSQCALAGVR